MRFVNFLKDRNILFPVLGMFIIISCLIFFMVFNLGLETFRSSRGIASDENRSSNPDLELLVIKDLAKVLEGRVAKHGEKPSLEEQFLFGLLEGNYMPFKVGNKIVSLKLKNGQKALRFISVMNKKDLVQSFKSVYFSESVSLADPVESRAVASEEVSYSLLENDTVMGHLDFKFSKDQDLLEIIINRL